MFYYMIKYADKVTSPEKILKDVKLMNSFGPRLTGNMGHRNFIRYLKKELMKRGLDVYSDPFRFKRWEEKDSSFKIEGEEIHISSVFPYSGRTDEDGVTAELVHVDDKRLGYLNAKGKIAVVGVDELNFLPSEIAFDKRSSLPEDVTIPEKYDGPVATAFVNFPFLKAAKACGAKAVVCIWKGMSDKRIDGQYLPFILPYQGIPAIWVNESDGEKVLEAAKEHKVANLKLVAEKERSAVTETFYTILEGKNTKEAIIINTHTDGTNCIEENGPIALLNMIDYFRDKELERNLIFVFVSGHFRLPSFKTIAGGGVQATSKWLAMHRDLWDGIGGHTKAVAGVAVEHLGCKMFKDVDGEYKQVGDIETELSYTGNDTLDKLYLDCVKERDRYRVITMRGHNFLHFGEGQPLFNCGIPDIALVTAPDCLCAISDNDEMDKFDEELMYEQVDMFINVVERLLKMSAGQIGPCDGYSMITLGKKSPKSLLNRLRHKR